MDVAVSKDDSIGNHEPHKIRQNCGYRNSLSCSNIAHHSQHHSLDQSTIFAARIRQFLLLTKQCKSVSSLNLNSLKKLALMLSLFHPINECAALRMDRYCMFLQSIISRNFHLHLTLIFIKTLRNLYAPINCGTNQFQFLKITEYSNNIAKSKSDIESPLTL